jgi:NAD(P)-dependent dehydrogenase (short-subunit alcohol dehydrogenase family)
MSGRLDGQVALVTGGGRGIGRAIGEALAAAGARVALAARSGDELAEAVAAAEAGGGVARGWTLDVTDLGAVAGVVAEAARHGITVLCVSPGLVRTRMVEESLLGAAGRRWRPQITDVPPEEYRPAQRTGDLLVRIAAGDADPLVGRFLHAEDDLDELLADAGRVAAEDPLTLRLREWPGG